MASSLTDDHFQIEGQIYPVVDINIPRNGLVFAFPDNDTVDILVNCYTDEAQDLDVFTE